MKPVWMYLDEAQARGLAANDSDIAAKLGVTKAAVCDWRKGRTAPAEDAAAKLAALLSKPEVMAECAAARAKTPEGRKMWEKLARIAAAAVVLMVSSVGTHISNGFDGQYAPRIPMNTVFRSNRGVEVIGVFASPSYWPCWVLIFCFFCFCFFCFFS